jgi:hypothetical protein
MTATKTIAEKAKGRRLNTAGASKRKDAAAPKAPEANPEWNYPTAKQMDDAKKAKPDAAQKMLDEAKAATDAAVAKANKARTTRKPADKAPDAGKGQKKADAAKSAVEFVVRVAKPGQTINAIADIAARGARPTKGAALFAHTHAALTILGMLDGKGAKMSTLLSLIGHTAVTWHLKERNFETSKDDMVTLTTTGLNKFKDRKIDAGLANAYVTLFLDGKIGKELGTLRAGQTYQIAV